MPWSMTPVVPTVLRPPMLPSRCVDSLGHHGRCSLTGLDPFTHDALRPAHSLSTLRSLPRDSPRKTRYGEVFNRSQLRAVPRFIPVSTDGTSTRWLMSACAWRTEELRTAVRYVRQGGRFLALHVQDERLAQVSGGRYVCARALPTHEPRWGSAARHGDAALSSQSLADVSVDRAARRALLLAWRVTFVRASTLVSEPIRAASARSTAVRCRGKVRDLEAAA